MMKGYKLGKQLYDGLTAFMERKGYNSVHEFQGIALKHLTTFPTGFNGKAMVDERKCIGCGMCADACVTTTIEGAIKIGSNKIAIIDKNVCIGCGLCNVVCKTKAVSVVEYGM
jgi:dihydropyrimidine dehydrogenase (NAD+) subunit PreA